MSIVIPRSTWGPRYDNGVAIIGVQEWLNAGKELWLHHSITNPFGSDASLAQDCQHMRDFEQIGENRFGSGISYTWVVMPSGRVFQGHDIDRQGTHTYQRNNRSRAICLAGNYDVTGLPSRMERAVSALLRELGATLDGGHRDVYPTACPGRYAYDRIGEINRLASSGEPIDPGGDDVSAEEVWTKKILSYYDPATEKLVPGSYTDAAELLKKSALYTEKNWWYAIDNRNMLLQLAGKPQLTAAEVASEIRPGLVADLMGVLGAIVKQAIEENGAVELSDEASAELASDVVSRMGGLLSNKEA